MNTNLTAADLAEHINACIKDRFRQIVDRADSSAADNHSFALVVEENATEEDRRLLGSEKPAIVLECLEQALESDTRGVGKALAEHHLKVSFQYNSKRVPRFPANYVLAKIEPMDGHPLREAKYLPEGYPRHFVLRLFSLDWNPSISLFNGLALVGVKAMGDWDKDFYTSIFERVLQEEKRVLEGCSKISEAARFVQSCLEQYGGEQVATPVRTIRSLGLVDAFCDASVAATGSKSPTILDPEDWASTSAPFPFR